MSTYVALLRGINVGNHNRIAMGDLRDTFADEGFTHVETYIQSGNAVFDVAPDEPEDSLADRIARSIHEHHAMEISVIVRPATDLVEVAAGHPWARGDDGNPSVVDPKLLHVVFLSSAPTAAARAALDRKKFEPDGWYLDGRTVYAYYPNGSARSKLTIDVFERALEVRATARNLTTVRRLVDMIQRR